MKNHFSVMIAVLTSLRIGAVRLVGSKEADTKRARDNMVSRTWQTMVAAFAFAVFVAAAVSAQGNPEAATIKNPSRPPTPNRLPRASRAFKRHCATCHGINAEGGPGNDLIPAAPDLTDDTWDHGSTDGEIFDNIKNGMAPDFNMVPWKDQLKDEDIWNVVNYLRSIAKKK